MPTRILISHESRADLPRLEAALKQAGATSIAPIEGLPDTLLALVDETDADAFLARASALEAVRHAERDRPRYTS